MHNIEYLNHFLLEKDYWWFKGQRIIVDNLIKKYKTKKKNFILDAGCGTGFNTLYLKKHGKVIGIDNSENALKFCKKRGLKNIILSDIAKTKFKNNSFDIITCIGVFYHKNVKPKKTLKEFKRILKKDGIIIITTPALNLLRNKYFRSYHDTSMKTARRYSLNKFQTLFQQNNYKVLKVSYFTFFLFFPILLLRLFNNTMNLFFKSKVSKSDIFKINNLLNYILIKLMILESCIINYTFLPLGVDLVVALKKKIIFL